MDYNQKKRKYNELRTELYRNVITQIDLAKALGQSRTTISAKLRGDAVVSLPDVVIIAKLLNISNSECMRMLLEQ